MLHHPPRSNPDTHKAGDSPKAIPAGYAGSGRTGPAVQCAVIVGSHRFQFAAQFIDFREPSRSHAAGHGLNDRPGCTGSDFSFHNGSDT